MILFGKRVFADVIKDLEMRLSLIRVFPESNYKCLYRHFRGEDTYRRKCYEDNGRDWSDGSTSQGMPRIASSHQKLGERQKDFLLEFLEEPTLLAP